MLVYRSFGWCCVRHPWSWWGGLNKNELVSTYAQALLSYIYNKLTSILVLLRYL